MANSKYYCKIRCTLIKKIVNKEIYLTADIPFYIYSLAIVIDGEVYLKKLIPLNLENTEIDAYVHVIKSDEQAIKGHSCYIGDNKEIIEDTTEYRLYIPHDYKHDTLF